MALQWFYQAMGEEIGPVSSAELRNLAQRGTITADTLVKNAPDGAWILAERVQGLFSVPSATPPPTPVVAAVAVEAQPPTKACPFCGEQILAVAIKCKHCGSNLSENSTQKRVVNAEQGRVSPSNVLGVITLLLPIVSIMFAVLWIGSMPLGRGPDVMLIAVAWMTVFVSSILITIDTSIGGVGGSSDRERSRIWPSGPAAWFLFCLVLWVVAFPAWMHRRRVYGLKSFFWWSIAIVVFYLLFTFCFGAFIDYQVEHLRRQL